MKISGFLTALIVTAALFSSCNTQQKAYTYIENYSDTTKKYEIKYTEPLIQKNDLLSIFIYSASLDPATDVIYNLPNLGGSTTGGSPQGFLVDNNGNIDYPRIGILKAEGLTKPELAEVIKTKINQPVEVLKDPTVIVRLLNFKIMMIGEVASPGPISVPGERVNILEAIGLAGDITIYGKKNEVVVIREVDGEVQYGEIDLSSKDLFQSPYFQLRQNDIVLVNAGKNKSRLNEQLFAQRISLGLSVISAIALLYNIFR
jgi:polysaccharide export outer membrane protein